MSKFNGYVCDCWQQLHKTGAWWDQGQGGLIKLPEDGLNGGERRWLNLCHGCRAALHKAVMVAVKAVETERLHKAGVIP